MNEVIAVSKDLCALDETSASLKPGLDFRAWCEVGKSLSRASRSLQWWIGDWLNYGVKEYGDRKALAIQHAGQFGIGEDMLKHCMWVSEKVINRLTSLSWTHHREVASLSPKEQKQWLKLAEDKEWSVSELRQAIRQDEAEVKHKDKGRLGQDYNPIEFALRTVAWFDAQEPIDDWTTERRHATKQALDPVVAIWKAL